MALTLVALGIRVGIAALFLVAAAAKLLAGQSHTESWLHSYDLLPRRVVPACARLLPVGEALVGSVLLWGAFGAGGTATAVVALVGLTSIVALALARRRQADCGCFGAWSAPLSWRVVARNLAMIVALAATIPITPSLTGIAPWPAVKQTGVVLATAIALVFACRRYIQFRKGTQISRTATDSSHGQRSTTNRPTGGATPAARLEREATHE